MSRIKEKLVEEYWLKKLSGDLSKVSLPLTTTGKEREAGVREIKQTQHHVEEIPTTVSAKLIKAARNSDIALFILVISGLNIVLTRYTGTDDLVLGTIPPAAHENNNQAIFCRNQIISGITVKEFITQTKEDVLKAINYSGYHTDDLVEMLRVRNNTDTIDIFNTAFIYEPFQKKNQYLDRFELLVILSSHNGRLHLQIKYPAPPGSHEIIKGFSQNLIATLEYILNNPTREIGSLSILCPQEKDRLLYDFNRTGTVYPQYKTLHQLFEEQAEKTPDYTALVGVHETHHPHEEDYNMSHLSYMSYKELDKKSNQLAAKLIEKDAKPGTIVGIMVERTVHMIIGLLAILKTGAAYLPLDPEFPEARIKYIIENSNVEVLVTTPQLQVKIKAEAEENGGEPGLHLHFIHIHTAPAFAVEPSSSTLTSTCRVSPTNPAYVIYTSGSTGNPKGVMVRHQNVVNFIIGMTSVINFSPGKTILALTTISFDIFLLETLLPLTAGLKVVIAVEDEQKDPQLLKDVILHQRVEMIQATPSRLQLLLTLQDELQCLAGVKELMVGGEAFPPFLFESIKTHFQGKIYNLYGPTETTVWSTIKDLSHGQPGGITIGTPIANTQIYIVGPGMQVQPLGAAGELLIGGDGVAAGYLNNVELTAEKFGHDLWDLQDYRDFQKKEILEKSPGKKDYRVYKSYALYKTGDLARWLPTGEIEFWGRLDHQVKIRGFRVEPGEIERQLLEHENVEKAVVTVKKMNEDKYLCAYIVPCSSSSTLKEESADIVDATQLRNHLARRLPLYMIPSFFILLDKIPLTPNGKLDRKALPNPDFHEIRDFIPPTTSIEKKLVDIWAEVLFGETQQHPPTPKIGIDDNFFELGGHSLKATILLSRIHKEFNIEIPMGEMFKTPDIRNLAKYIKETEQEKYQFIRPVEKKDHYVLSPTQKRLYILQQLDVNSTGYNISYAVSLQGDTNVEELETTFKKLVSRHEILRTSFEILKGEPQQRVHHLTEFEIEYYDMKEVEESEGARGLAANWIKDFIRPFDLSRTPLLRIGLIKVKENERILIVDMHHLVTDGTSSGILVKEFTTLYSGKDLSPLRLHYKDFARWQNSNRQQARLKRQETYWQQMFTGELPILNIPTDYPRPAVQSFAGNSLSFILSEEETNHLKDTARAAEATIYMVVLALFGVLLSKLSGQENILIGTPVAARRHVDLEQIIGSFINTLVMKNYPENHKTFREFLKEVKTCALDAYDNQEYPFEYLVDKVPTKRDLSRNPLFDVMFILHNELENTKIPAYETVNLKIKPYQFEKGSSQFDLTLIGLERHTHLGFTMEYCTKLFKQETIERFVSYFKNICSSIMAHPGTRISEIDILGEEEKHRLLVVFNDTTAPYPNDKTLQQLFEEQVKKTPDYTALVGVRETHHPYEKNYNMSHLSYMSYKELDKKSNQLAAKLTGKDAKPGIIVGIMVERTVHMIIGLLAILKTGAAYLPLDPEFPEARIKYIIKNSNVEVLVTTPQLQVKIKAEAEENAGEPGLHLHFIHIHTDPAFAVEPSSSTLTSTCRMSPANPAYVIYTSGSTGNPKGVMVQHKNAVNFITGMTAAIDFSPGKAMLALTTISFDIFFLETLLPIIRGLKVVLADEDRQKDPALLERLILNTRVNMVQFTPSRLQLLLNLRGNLQALAGVKELMVGGEVFPSLLLEKVKEHFQGKIYNMYGPTETTIWSAVKELTHTLPGEITIGTPIANTRIYIVDRNNQLQPLGVSGELVIGGDGTAQGYLNNVELTVEKFDHDLWDLQDYQDFQKKETWEKVPGKKDYWTYKSHKSYALYKTGDLGRWLSTEEIEFIGRLDHQVKIRGFRIELEEIEEQLLKQEHIKEAVVVVKIDASGHKSLCAYMVPQPGGSPTSPDNTVLREQLSVKLPAYMIPAYFVYLERMPLTPNGKINRKALPEPDLARSQPGSTGTFVAPNTDNEKLIASIWKEILHVEEVSINDNFFDLGANSMHVIQLNWKLKETFGKEIPIALLFRNLSISFLDHYLREEETGKEAEKKVKQTKVLDRDQETLKDTISKLTGM